MAFLLLLHEKMRLQRKVNKLTLRECQMANKKERITKNIKRIQDMYSKKQTYLQKQADLLQKQFTTNIQNSMGLGTQGQMFNPYGGGGMTTFIYGQMCQMLQSATKKNNKNEKLFADNAQLNSFMQAATFGNLEKKYSEVDDKGNPKTGAKVIGYIDKNTNIEYGTEYYEAYQAAMTSAQMNQSQAQAWCQNMTNQYQQNISIWLEANQAELERQQDEALLPLEMQETEYDLERESCEAQLADAKARLENIQQACSEGIKNSAPTFGLG